MSDTPAPAATPAEPKLAPRSGDAKAVEPEPTAEATVVEDAGAEDYVETITVDEEMGGAST
jgi:hypothetical protein